jgi:hypothetical protein
MANFLSQLQEYSARHLEEEILKNYILNGILLLILSCFVYVQTDMSKQLSENRHILLPHPELAFPSTSLRSRQK